VKKIIADHGGEISVRNLPERGGRVQDPAAAPRPVRRLFGARRKKSID